MQITFSASQTQLLREFVERVNLAHIAVECEPPGYSIVVDFAGPFSCNAEARCGPQSIDLGEVEVSPEQNNWIPTDDTPKYE